MSQYKSYHREYVDRLDYLFAPRVGEHDLTTHSQFVDLLTNFGALGLLLYLSISIQLLARSWRATRLHAESKVRTARSGSIACPAPWVGRRAAAPQRPSSTAKGEKETGLDIWEFQFSRNRAWLERRMCLSAAVILNCATHERGRPQADRRANHRRSGT